MPKIYEKEVQDVRAETLRLLNKSPKTRLSTALKRIGKLAEAQDTKFFQKDGIVTDSRDVADNRTRLDANKFLVQLHDALPSEKHDVTVTTLEDKLRDIHNKREGHNNA